VVLHQLLLAAAVLDEDLYITQGVRNGLNVRSDLLEEFILQVSTCQRVEDASNSVHSWSVAAAAWAARARQRGRSKLASHHSEGGDRRGFSEGAANALLACSKRGAASAAQQARRSKRGAGARAGEAAKFERCVLRPTLQRGHWCTCSAPW